MAQRAIRQKQWFGVRRLSAAERALYCRLSGGPPPGCLIVCWPWWWRSFRGLALAQLILVRDDGDSELIMHELTHVAQFRAAPLSFWWRYLRALRREGYAANPYEREANAFARRARAALAENKTGPADGGVNSGGECAASRSNTSGRH